MAKLPKAIYAPGELDKVRQKLGDLDDDEARRMSEILGGEVGWERTQEEEANRRKPKVRNEVVDVHVKGSGSRYSKSQPKHRVELPLEGEDNETSIRRKLKKLIIDPSDDPSFPIKLSYWERVKMDKFAAQPEFEIKNSTQVFYSTISIFGETPDYVNPDFINRRMKEIYRKIEVLVTSMRSMFPRNNLQRNEKLRKVSSFAISVLDVLRYWNIEKISTDLTKIQASPRNTKIVDFSDILKAIYKPLFILDKLDPEMHIKGTFKLFYKVLYLENAAPEAKSKYQEMLKNALTAYVAIRRDIRYILYPMLLKLLSDRWMTYEEFFKYRKNRFMSFINASDADQIIPVSQEDMVREMPTESSSADGQESDEDSQQKQEKESQRKKAAAEMESKAVSRAQHVLESLFPRAGWERISLFPDLYPYFHDVFNFSKGYELISPTDSIQQILILMRILEELSYGIRYVSFGTTAGPDGNFERIDEIIGRIMNEWHGYIENTFDKLYIPRLIEYCRILNSPGYRPSSYSQRILNELHLVKKLCFLPHYKFTPLAPPTIHKRSVKAVFPEVRTLRRYLTVIANNIEQGNKKGGTDANASCNGIDNPWEEYNFPVKNPVSARIDALLDARESGKKNNAALIFFTLSVTVMLDYIMNNDGSWAYKEQTGSLFRSVNGEGYVPLMGVDTVVDADAIFKQTIKRQEQKENQNPS